MSYIITTPSEFHDALVARLTARLPSIPVTGYEEWGPVDITGPCVLVQWEDSLRGNLRNDGCYHHLFMLTAHCVVPKTLPRAALIALDLATEVERLLDHRALFFVNDELQVSSDTVGVPTVLNNGDTTFLLGLAGMEARGVQWQQPLYLGPSEFDPSEERANWRWAVNPVNPDDAGEYRPLE